MISCDIKKICKTPELIENYNKAINDKLQTWHCHHRFETDLNMSIKDLVSKNMYFDRPPEELIFLEPHEHLSLRQNRINKRKFGIKSTYSYLKKTHKKPNKQIGVYHKDTSTWYDSIEQASKALGYPINSILEMVKDEDSDFSLSRPYI